MPPLEGAGPGLAPGEIRPALILSIYLALVASVLMLAVSLEFFHRYFGSDVEVFRYVVVRQVPTLLFVSLLTWQKRSKRQLSFPLRVCVPILLLQLALVAFAQGSWSYMKMNRQGEWWALPMEEKLPLGLLVLVCAALLVVALVWSATRTSQRRILPWLRRALLPPLAFMLVLGLWLPIACRSFEAFESWNWAIGESPVIDSRFLWIVLTPPSLLAFALMVPKANRAFSSALESPRIRRGLLASLFLVAALGIVLRATARSAEAYAYTNILPLLMSVAALCLLFIGALALAHWLSLRRAERRSKGAGPWEQQGTIIAANDSENPAIARYEGWLAGVVMETQGLDVQSDSYRLRVPAGAEVIAPIPLWTTRPQGLNEQRRLLRIGDEVRASGFVRGEGETPYRRSAAPVAGSEGIVLIKKNHVPWSAWQEVTLAVWRPTLLYLLVVGLIALPGLSGSWVQ